MLRLELIRTQTRRRRRLPGTVLDRATPRLIHFSRRRFELFHHAYIRTDAHRRKERCEWLPDRDAPAPARAGRDSLFTDPRCDSSVTFAKKTTRSARHRCRARPLHRDRGRARDERRRPSRARLARPPPVTLSRMRRVAIDGTGRRGAHQRCGRDTGFGIDVDALEFGEKHHRVEHLAVFDRKHRTVALAQGLRARRRRSHRAASDWRAPARRFGRVGRFASAVERSSSTGAPALHASCSGVNGAFWASINCGTTLPKRPSPISRCAASRTPERAGRAADGLKVVVRDRADRVGRGQHHDAEAVAAGDVLDAALQNEVVLGGELARERDRIVVLGTLERHDLDRRSDTRHRRHASERAAGGR